MTEELALPAQPGQNQAERDVPPTMGRLLGPLRAAWDSSPALVAVTWGPRHLLVYQNATSARLIGARELGVPLDDAFPELRGRGLAVPEQVRTTGVTVEMPRQDVGIHDVGGDELLLQYVVAPLGHSPPYDGVVMTAVDVTAEARAEQAAIRAQLVARVAERMNAATDPDAALQALTEELVPAVADLAAVYITPAASAPHDERARPAATSIAADLLAAAGPPPPGSPRDGPSPWDDALAAGQAVLIELGAEPDPSAVQDAASAGWLDAVQARNIAVLPLVVAGDLAGAVVLLAAGPRAPYAKHDLPFLEIISGRAGAAVAHLRSYQQQREMALNLQRALLPSAPPPLPGLEVAARYVAGSADVEIGGDWWDVHHLGAGRVGVGVGDVSGRGVPAAVLMGQARSGMRAAAHADLSPVDVLTVLDAQVTDLVQVTDRIGDRLPAKFATAAYVVIEPFDETLCVANAGHPPLLVRHHDGRVEQVQAPPGPPLGLGMAGYEETVVPFEAGALLVAFTDGLVESRTVDLETGISRLAHDLAAADPNLALEDLASQLLARADGTDDTALVLLQLTPTAVPAGRFQQMLTSLAEVPAARRAVTDMVSVHAPALIDATAQVCAELLANAMLHAGPPVRLRALATGDRVVIEVADDSALRPKQRVAQRDDEHGRGLPIVSAFAQTWGSRITREGKSTWAELRQEDPTDSVPRPVRG